MKICSEWDQYIVENIENMRLCPSVLRIGQIDEIKEWPNQTLTKVEDIFYFFEVFALKSFHTFGHEQEQNLRNWATYSLFTVINYHAKQFFPVEATHRTYLLLLFHAFFLHKYNYSPNDNQKWTNKLIYFRNSLNLA